MVPLPTVNWVSPINHPTITMPPQSICWGPFLNWGSLFPNVSSLYQTDIKLDSTCAKSIKLLIINEHITMICLKCVFVQEPVRNMLTKTKAWPPKHYLQEVTSQSETQNRHGWKSNHFKLKKLMGETASKRLWYNSSFFWTVLLH